MMKISPYINSIKNETKEEEKLQVIHRYHMSDIQESQIKQLKQKIYKISNHMAATGITHASIYPDILYCTDKTIIDSYSQYQLFCCIVDQCTLFERLRN